MYTAAVENFGKNCGIGSIRFNFPLTITDVCDIIRGMGLSIISEAREGNAILGIYGNVSGTYIAISLSVSPEQQKDPDQRVLLNLFYTVLAQSMQNRGVSGQC